MIDEPELETSESLFDYVDEKEYARIVHQRQSEGFTMDDGMSTLALCR